MCDPVTAAVTAVASTALGTMQSIAGYQQQQAEYQYQQQAAQYQQQMAERNAQIAYNQEMAAYHASQRSYDAQIEANAAAANRAYQYEQLKLKGEYDKARAQAAQLMVDKLKAQGAVLATGQTGGSRALLVSDAEREYGRDLAALGRNLGYFEDEYSLTTHQEYLDAKSANALAAAKRMIKPVKGYVEQAYVGPAPSAASMVLGIGQSIVGGISTYSSLKAPKGTTAGSKTMDKVASNLTKNPLSTTKLTSGGIF